jgi:hypothetical protein
VFPVADRRQGGRRKIGKEPTTCNSLAPSFYAVEIFWRTMMAGYDQVYRRSLDDPNGFWGEAAEG